MSQNSLILVLLKKIKEPATDMTKIAIKSDKITPFGGIFSIMQQFDRSLSQVIDSILGVRCKFYGYQYSEILRSLMYIYFCGGSCVEDLSSHLFKKFLGYRPGVAVIGDTIVGIENSDGNTNVRFHQKDTLKRFFERLEQRGLAVNRFRADCGSCSEDIVSEVEKHCKSFYIRANRCSSLYDDIFALRGWSKEAINGIDFELNSILVEKWKG